MSKNHHAKGRLKLCSIVKRHVNMSSEISYSISYHCHIYSDILAWLVSYQVSDPHWPKVQQLNQSLITVRNCYLLMMCSTKQKQGQNQYLLLRNRLSDLCPRRNIIMANLKQSSLVKLRHANMSSEIFPVFTLGLIPA